MCPLRFILVFLSAVLAGYFAWKTVRSSPGNDDIATEDSAEGKISSKVTQEMSFKKVLIRSTVRISSSLISFPFSFI